MTTLESKAVRSYLESEAALDHFLASVRAGTWPLAQWTHAAHLTLATGVAWSTPKSEVLGEIRSIILHYNACHGVANTPDSGYHETLTCFWTETVRGALKTLPRGAGRLAAVRLVVDTYAQRRRLADERYGFDVLRHREARVRWIGPPGHAG